MCSYITQDATYNRALMLQASPNKNTFSSKPRPVVAWIDAGSSRLRALNPARDFLAIELLNVLEIGFDRSLRVFLSMGEKFDA